MCEEPWRLRISCMFDPVAQHIHRCRDERSLAMCLLHGGLEQSHARLGNVQLMDWKSGCLEIKAQSGFGDEFLNFFKRVKLQDGTACARALRNRDAIIV